MVPRTVSSQQPQMRVTDSRHVTVTRPPEPLCLTLTDVKKMHVNRTTAPHRHRPAALAFPPRLAELRASSAPCRLAGAGGGPSARHVDPLAPHCRSAAPPCAPRLEQRPPTAPLSVCACPFAPPPAVAPSDAFGVIRVIGFHTRDACRRFRWFGRAERRAVGARARASGSGLRFDFFCFWHVRKLHVTSVRVRPESAEGKKRARARERLARAFPGAGAFSRARAREAARIWGFTNTGFV